MTTLQTNDLPSLAQPSYIGIDPGVGGAIAALTGDTVVLQKLDATDGEVWDFIGRYLGTDCRAVVEQQTARPTMVKDYKTGEWRQTILASTCYLYGSYKTILAMLTCAAIPHEDCPPKRWQKALHVPDKEKGMDQRRWKNVLKSKAERTFPQVKVTLASADALLIADYCRKKHEGRL